MSIPENSKKLLLIPPEGSTRVAPRKFNFTKRALEALPAPTNGQRSYYYDSATRGLAIAVTALGRKTFILYRKVAGRPERITIGPFPDLTIEQARGQAMFLNGKIAQGENPAASRRAVHAEMTLGELLATFITLYAKEHTRGWRRYEAMFRRYLQCWRLRKLSNIRKPDVVALHLHIGRTHGQYAANRTLELLRAMFNRAKKDWGYEGDNPAAGIRSFKEHKRDRFLNGDELARLFKALGEEANETVRDYILISLLTGARRSNVQSMRFDEIDWARGEWLIPAAKAKEDEPLRLPLMVATIEILTRRRASSPGEWVFPSFGRTGHLVDLGWAWRLLLKRAGLDNVRLHDLRRTLGSWECATGASLPVIAKSLGHSSLESTAIYARLDLNPVRAAVTRATDAMLLAGGVGLLGDGK